MEASASGCLFKNCAALLLICTYVLIVTEQFFQCPEQDLEAAAKLYFSSWIHLATTPCGSALDATKMFFPTVLPRKSHFRAAAKMRSVKSENFVDTCIASEVAKGIISQENRIDCGAVSTKIIVGADNEKSVVHTRVLTAAALGIFVSRLPEVSLLIVIHRLWNDLISLSGVNRQVRTKTVLFHSKNLPVNYFLLFLESIMVVFLFRLLLWFLLLGLKNGITGTV